MVAVSGTVLRLVGAVARRADARLAYGAARNAASCVREHQAARLDDARLLREVMPAPAPPADHRRTGG